MYAKPGTAKCGLIEVPFSVIGGLMGEDEQSGAKGEAAPGRIVVRHGGMQGIEEGHAGAQTTDHFAGHPATNPEVLGVPAVQAQGHPERGTHEDEFEERNRPLQIFPNG